MSFKTLAILVAAGRGERMGATRPKAFLDLAGVPMLLRAARVFEAAPSVDALVAVVPSSELESAQEILEPITKLFGVASGGARRQDSVQAGLDLAPPGFDGVVLVHDAARPLVTVEIIEAVAAAAREAGVALLRQGYEAALAAGATLTDEAMAVERLGQPVATVPGASRNRKITTVEDLAWAELVLRRERVE
jgi:2-C-methyl-D-erythritol 4-phosphate cytidylyltransferase